MVWWQSSAGCMRGEAGSLSWVEHQGGAPLRCAVAGHTGWPPDLSGPPLTPSTILADVLFIDACVAVVWRQSTAGCTLGARGAPCQPPPCLAPCYRGAAQRLACCLRYTTPWDLPIGPGNGEHGRLWAKQRQHGAHLCCTQGSPLTVPSLLCCYRPALGVLPAHNEPTQTIWMPLCRQFWLITRRVKATWCR